MLTFINLQIYDYEANSPVSGMDNRNISLNSNGHGRPEMETSSHAEEKLSLQQMYILYQHTLRTVRLTHQVKPLMILLIHFLKFIFLLLTKWTHLATSG